VPKAESRRLEHVRDAWMHVWLVAAIWLKLRSAEERWQILVHENVLQTRNDQPSGALKDVLVAPRRIHLLDAISQFVVPAEEENGER
jgi:hypothetical protein